MNEELLPSRRFSVILADPPWRYRNYTDAKNGAAAAHYPGMKVEELCAIPVSDLAEKNSLLFLWASLTKPKAALQVMASWGFEFVTTPFVWNKTYADGTPYCGLGFWSRTATEVIFMGRLGKGVPRLKTATNVRQVITAPVTKPHSSKPPAARTRIVDLIGDVPRIELFARNCGEGWSATGQEYDNMDINKFIERSSDDASGILCRPSSSNAWPGRRHHETENGRLRG